MPISDRQIAGAAATAGFTGNDLVTAVAVALAESGGNPRAVNRANVNGSTDYGLWQINSIHAELLKTGNWSNPVDNARMAYRVYADAGKKFTPWVAYTTGRHRVFVGRARRAAGNPAETRLPGAVNAGFSVPAGNVVTDPGTWVRIGMFLGGGALLIWALLSMTGATNLIPVTKVARKVMK